VENGLWAMVLDPIASLMIEKNTLERKYLKGRFRSKDSKN
jgi:hypothetical protein